MLPAQHLLTPSPVYLVTNLSIFCIKLLLLISVIKLVGQLNRYMCVHSYLSLTPLVSIIKTETCTLVLRFVATIVVFLFALILIPTSSMSGSRISTVKYGCPIIAETKNRII